MTSWSHAIKSGTLPASEAGSPGNPVAELYAKMNSLPAQTQMFMVGCRPEREAKYDRI